MNVRVIALEEISGVVVAEPRVFGDARGQFVETYRREWVPGAREMIQANRADRRAGALVGLHYHLHQADFWYVPFGSARMVLHDLRSGSPTEGATSEPSCRTHSQRAKPTQAGRQQCR